MTTPLRQHAIDDVPAGPDGAAPPFSAAVLAIDAAAETARIAAAIETQVLRTLRRRGVVLGLSGGIDSSVTAALCVRALGPGRVLGVLMPERDSDPDSLRLGRALAETLGIATVVEDIAPMLDAAGCYARRDALIRTLVPEFGDGWGCKVVIAAAADGAPYSLTALVVQAPDGEQRKLRLPLDAYLGLVAATNMKQRTRKQLEYFHADRLNRAVAGTPNRLEYDQGFFVKNGDGAADLKPIAHLYKTQVYALAAHLGVPDEIRRRPPTTDTWSLAQTQEEFYFALPWDRMDLCLYALNHAVPAAVAAPAVGLAPDQIARVWRDIASKRRVAAYLHSPPLLVEEV
ncbi:NAD(+) synthase [Rhodoplanes sp. TEM]|uniref:NH(3)-dependent NAD(+) synthetase n=1 Tax=Rhodoplanes tepidamans TaxID=200616 RepID=A0ABT5JA22_RHOTP|nr:MULTISPECIES: NAD(+) synthase [Rhodoplanes]MDC7786461.1 NAD(+) synthase [Rhodoplanes tepidamans]MDC7985103.1 NAD(+) synthase [Rhodoplanes sp. TEM]MDQ0357346.1 NAD+ synthase [Rhodoplanes tepidamans]